jgi:ABC-2 type transport system permease protein
MSGPATMEASAESPNAPRSSALAKYAQVMSVGLQDTFVYRWNFVLRSLFSLVPLTGMFFIWTAIFKSRGVSVGTYDFREMIFYFLVTMLVENLVTPTEDEWRIAAEIREGQVSALIVKPLNHLAYRLSLFVSFRGLYTLVTLPVVAAVFLCLHDYLRLPAHWTTWPVFALSVSMAALIQFFIAYSLAMIAFWVLEISTIVFIFYSFEYFLSGQVFPLDIMPAWLQAGLKFSPFTYELFFPVQVYLERIQGPALASGLAMQAVWLVIAFFAARTLWKSGVRHYQAVGG